MTKLKYLFHFLGGIHLALALILVSALIVVAGTALESQTGSHLLASQWTYESPVFLILLCLFFINILFSACRRWPFKKKHIPFLITHFGLLMIISGTILKNHFGLQGQLSVWEGSGNQHVLLPYTYALSIEKKENVWNSTTSSFIVLDSFHPTFYSPVHFPQLKCKIMSYAPHVKEILETWIKDSYAYVSGFPLTPVQTWEPTQTFPEGSSRQLNPSKNSHPWSILALRTSHIQQALQHAYLQGLTLRLKSKNDSSTLLDISLLQALQKTIPVDKGILTITLHLSYPILDDHEAPSLTFHWRAQEGHHEQKFTIPLQGQEALYVKSDPSNWLGASFTVDLIRLQPNLCLVDDERGNIFLFAFDRYGRFHGENVGSGQVQTLISYNQGFDGYGVQAIVPIPNFPASREDKERAEANQLTLQLQQALSQHPSLAPPLHFFEQACKRMHMNFAETFVEFLTEWKASPSYLFHPVRPLPSSLDLVMRNLNWEEVSYNDQQASQWTVHLLEQLENASKQGEDPLNFLERNRWPFLPTLQQSQNTSPLNLLAQQISSLTAYLPSLNVPPVLSLLEQTRLLSAYCRVYGIDYPSLCPFQGLDKEQLDDLERYWKTHASHEKENLQQEIVFETPLTHRLIPDSAPLKLEERRPGIMVEVQQGQHKQSIALAYDASGMGLKWPILNGNYLMRFQPRVKALPYRIRLRQARQISYPQSTQVYSYESDLLISENQNSPIAQTLSMNHVYETWDGYRFYLAGIGSAADSGIKHIQLAVNHDPAKYFLTYPGAFLVFVGTILLFWIYPYRKK
jgi:hypothetical protein